jgi:thioesterase domain-containing protein/acyl carrier protein
VLGLEAIPPDASFFELGGHSLLAARLLARVEQGFGIRLSMAALFEHATLREMAELLHGQRGDQWTPPLIPIQPRGARIPFFCVGAGPFSLPLARWLGPEQPFLGVDLGKDHGFQPPFRFDEIAASVVRAVRARQAEGPYQLGGWCLHGVVAYEAACQLRRQGAEVSTLVLFDAPHPSFWRGTTMDSERVRFHMQQARRMTLDGALKYARDRWQGGLFRIQTLAWRMGYRGCLRTGVRPRGWLRDMLQVLYYTAREYEPELYPGLVHLFRSQERPGGGEADPAFGWRPLLGERLIVREVPGTHRTMFQEPSVSTMAAELMEILGFPPIPSYRDTALPAGSWPEPDPSVKQGD